jgi:hypothetical protein
VIRRPHIAALAAAAASVALLAGCGGGGGADDAQGDVPPPDASLAVAVGAGPEQSAALAISALGSPGAVDPAGAGQKLAGYDSFGNPHDAFEQQVTDGAGSGSEADTAAAIPADTPINGDPLLAVPAPGTAPTPDGAPDPGAGAPVQEPRALEADFDISGEPVVAIEGDSIPPDTQQFLVKTVLATQVVLQLTGGLLPDGTDTVTLKEGESITLYNATAKRSYKIKLVDIRVA